ncbi:DUF7285 family protein [Halobaculum sp. P14]|uniref:DUF7285 family protein n=1 Tax=Halobaculum sp. P14 TaxID=3421638 RepID=UPI003EBA6469
MSSDARAVAEPTVALGATLAVVLGVSAYAVVLADTAPSTQRDRATPTLTRLYERLADGGVVGPDALDTATEAIQVDARVRVTLRAADRVWRVGPAAPPGAETAERTVSVGVAPGRVDPGTLRVEVWS